MKTTVIIVTYNRAATLPHAIRSLLIQKDDADLDILVVDDGSADGTPALLRDMARQHAELRVIRQPNQGVTAARNTGLRNLHPDAAFVTFLDSDDLSPAGRFAADLPRLKRDPALELTYGNMAMVDALDYDRLCPPPDAKTLDITGIHLSCAIFRRSLIARIGEFDPDLRQAEDTDYLLRIFESGTRFAQTESRCLYYLRHPGNMTKNLDEAQRAFAHAIHKSMRRRRNDPRIRLNKPDFEIQALRKVSFL